MATWYEIIGNLGPVAILFSAGVAAWGINKAAETARKRATLDLIEKSESKEYYREISSIFRDTFAVPLRSSRIDDLVSAKSQSDRKLFRSILDFLNHYELMAIGIQNGSLDEKTYKTWMKTTVIRDWNSAAPVIQQIRWKWDAELGKWKYRGKAFENFEAIARRWAYESGLAVVMVSAKAERPPEEPRGVIDEAIASASSVKKLSSPTSEQL